MRITHDVHNHSLFSLCCYDPEATVENYVRRAKELGHTVYGLSNHLWDEKIPGCDSWYHKQMINYGLEARNCIPKDVDGMKVLIGTESEYYGARDLLGMSAETAKRFDYVLIPHTHMHMRGRVIEETDDVKRVRKEMAEKILTVLNITPAQADNMANTIKGADIDKLVTNPTVDIIKYNSEFMVTSFKQLFANPEFIKLAGTVPTSIAHPFHPCGFSGETLRNIQRAVPDEQYRECFRLAKRLGVGIEVNTASVAGKIEDVNEELPIIHIFKLALDEGCSFTFGTDTHTLAGLDNIRIGDKVSEIVGIKETDLMDFCRG